MKQDAQITNRCRVKIGRIHRMEHGNRTKRTPKLGLAALLVGIALTVGGLTVANAATNGRTLALLSPTPTQTANAGSVAQSGSSAVVTASTTSTPTSTATATVIATSTSTTTPTATPSTDSQTPNEAIIGGFPSLAQSYNLSCEYAAAAAVTLYWGNFVSENVFLSEVPSSPNPHLGFRGNINGTFGGITDYGVYAEALVPVLEARGFDATTFYGGVDQLKAYVAAGDPVVVWITTGKYTQRTPVLESYDGDAFTLVPGEHAVVIYGYDSGGVYMMDVSNGSYQYTEWSSFLTRWSYFDQMALVITPS
jgi:uncharacterized protein YvpB